MDNGFNDWRLQLAKMWKRDSISNYQDDYDYNAYYKANPSRAWNQLSNLQFGLGTHFPDGDETTDYKFQSHPTKAVLGENSWSNNDTVFHLSDDLLNDSDRTLDYLGSDLQYNNGGTKVAYGNSYVLPSVTVTPSESWSELVPNAFNTGWVYSDSPFRFEKGGIIYRFKNGNKTPTSKELFTQSMHKALYKAYKSKFPKFDTDSLKRLATYGTYQAALESGYGTSGLSSQHNYGGMKNGNKGWQSFNNMDEYANSFVDNLLLKFPEVANSLNLNGYINALFGGLYLYDPESGREGYLQKLQGVLNRVDGYIDKYFDNYIESENTNKYKQIFGQFGL